MNGSIAMTALSKTPNATRTVRPPGPALPMQLVKR